MLRALGIAFVTHPSCLLHEMGEGHPERPERLAAIEDKLIASRLDSLVRRAAVPAEHPHGMTLLAQPQHDAPSERAGSTSDQCCRVHTLMTRATARM